MRRATVSNRSEPSSWRHFYPRSPCGERPTTFNGDFKAGQFLSTLSLRRATAIGRWGTGARDISIHALLAESDPRKAVTTRGNHRYFYPRSPCGERLSMDALESYLINISIHALLAESDMARNWISTTTSRFLSTLSLRRATFFAIFKPQILTYFYPRSPCGERRHWQTGQSRTRQFLSTLSLRRATVGDTPPCCGCMISIHALLAESDLTFTFTLILLSVISIHARSGERRGVNECSSRRARKY